jgi:hypothetical protein
MPTSFIHKIFSSCHLLYSELACPENMTVLSTCLCNLSHCNCNKENVANSDRLHYIVKKHHKKLSFKVKMSKLIPSTYWLHDKIFIVVSRYFSYHYISRSKLLLKKLTNVTTSQHNNFAESRSTEQVAVTITADTKSPQYLCTNLTVVKEIKQITLSAYMFTAYSSIWMFKDTARIKLVKWTQNVIFAKTTK